MAKPIACVSGYFDPVHVGHLEYFKNAKKSTGSDYLIVIVNNDDQATLKKGRPFMPLDERMKILSEFRCVDQVVRSVDTDRTVCNTLETLSPKPDFFCNGGDQTNQSIPEGPICEKLKITLVDGLGHKIQSSSWLIEGTKEKTFFQKIWDLVEYLLYNHI